MSGGVGMVAIGGSGNLCAEQKGGESCKTRSEEQGGWNENHKEFDEGPNKLSEKHKKIESNATGKRREEC